MVVIVWSAMSCLLLLVIKSISHITRSPMSSRNYQKHDITWTAYLPPLFLLTRQTTRQTPRRKTMARSIPMNQPEEARVLCCGWWPAAMFRYVFTLWGGER